uniref:Uncharacterized protein n=1 Tax=Anopheles melas TaxID=34690 RepID=A0A182U7W9_9DIPT
MTLVSSHTTKELSATQWAVGGWASFMQGCRAPVDGWEEARVRHPTAIFPIPCGLEARDRNPISINKRSPQAEPGTGPYRTTGLKLHDDVDDDDDGTQTSDGCKS